MEVEDSNSAQNWPGRWSHLKKILERDGPLSHPDFEASPNNLQFMLDNCKVLVVGAGGLGCELLKNLCLMGFKHIHVIDMDTIDISNLNRQFLFRTSDVGKPKADVAAGFINKRIPGAQVTPHFKKIQDYDEDFYRQFHVVVCGLDSIVARRWINGMLISLLRYEDGELDQASVIPLIDGGTEGFRGNSRVILPGITACIECTLDLFPPQINFPLCTIAHTPRLPEHCIEYVRILLWSKENPFGEDVAIDGDDPAHVTWILEKAEQRAREYGITGVNYRLTQGVIKHIVPAVASTNAVIASACATEVFKIVSSAALPLNNYMLFNDTEGIYTYAYESEKKGFHFTAELTAIEKALAYTLEQSPGKLHILSNAEPALNAITNCNEIETLPDNQKIQNNTSLSENEAQSISLIVPACLHWEDCLACSQVPKTLTFKPNATLRQVLTFLTDSPTYQMRNPGVTYINADNKNRTLYLPNVPSIEERTRPNLSKTLKELGLEHGTQIVVADITTPNSVVFQLHLD